MFALVTSFLEGACLVTPSYTTHNYLLIVWWCFLSALDFLLLPLSLRNITNYSAHPSVSSWKPPLRFCKKIDTRKYYGSQNQSDPFPVNIPSQCLGVSSWAMQNYFSWDPRVFRRGCEGFTGRNMLAVLWLSGKYFSTVFAVDCSEGLFYTLML